MGEMEDIHSSVAVRAGGMVGNQEELDFFWDVRFDRIVPDIGEGGHQFCWRTLW